MTMCILRRKVWIFLDFYQLIGGLALFLYGMDTMGQGLEKLSGRPPGADPGKAHIQPH